jgi:hypothetical protein
MHVVPTFFHVRIYDPGDSALPAQSITGSVEGIISDPSGNAIAAAVLRMVADSTGAERSQSAAADGTFVLNAVPPGSYTLIVEQCSANIRSGAQHALGNLCRMWAC